jgi:hypothetical protein
LEYENRTVIEDFHFSKPVNNEYYNLNKNGSLRLNDGNYMLFQFANGLKRKSYRINKKRPGKRKLTFTSSSGLISKLLQDLNLGGYTIDDLDD